MDNFSETIVLSGVEPGEGTFYSHFFHFLHNSLLSEDSINLVNDWKFV